MIKNNEIALIVNTSRRSVRRSPIRVRSAPRPAGRVTSYTTIWGAEAAAEGIREPRRTRRLSDPGAARATELIVFTQPPGKPFGVPAVFLIEAK